MTSYGDKKVDWKLCVCVPMVNVSKTRVFLRHNQFQEYPMKTTCHQHLDIRHYTTVLPYHPTRHIHVHSEKVLAEYTQDKYTLACILAQDKKEDMVEISNTQIEYGSMFKRNDIDLVLTIVEKTHTEEYGSVVQNNKPCHFYILATWTQRTPFVLVRKILGKLSHLLNWFDF